MAPDPKAGEWAQSTRNSGETSISFTDLPAQPIFLEFVVLDEVLARGEIDLTGSGPQATELGVDGLVHRDHRFCVAQIAAGVDRDELVRRMRSAEALDVAWLKDQAAAGFVTEPNFDVELWCRIESEVASGELFKSALRWTGDGYRVETEEQPPVQIAEPIVELRLLDVPWDLSVRTSDSVTGKSLRFKSHKYLSPDGSELSVVLLEDAGE